MSEETTIQLPDAKAGKTLATLKSGALIALIYFLYSIFDSRYVLKADYNSLQISLAIIETEVKNINTKVDETNKAIKEAVHELRNSRNTRN